MGRLTSAPPQEDATIPATVGIAKIAFTGASKTYSGASKFIWFNAEPESVENRMGPEPGVATILIPVAEESDSVGTTSTHKVHEATRYPGINVFSAPAFANSKNFLFSQVFIYDLRRALDSILEADVLGDPVFVGYIVGYEWVGNVNSTFMRVRCEDARHFAKKAPTQGVVHHNSRAAANEQDVYIRAHQIVFNEGGDPNMYFDAEDEATSRNFPKFINKWFNRFRDEPGQDQDRHFIADDQVEVEGSIVDNPHTRHWRPGFAYNYVVNIHSDGLIAGLFTDKPTITELGEVPNVDHFPVNLNDVLVFPKMEPLGMWQQFFTPRANVGGAPQTGTTEFVSALGEMSPSGIPMIDNLHEFCRMVGNFSLAATFRTDGRMDIFPIRTTLSWLEDQGEPVGIVGKGPGTSGGKALTIIMPTDKPAFADVRPEVVSWNISLGATNYYNRFYFHGGKRFIQVTLSTLGKTTYTDHLLIQHQAYTPAAEWNPLTDKGTLQAGWSLDNQTEWIKLVDANNDLELFPDVFRAFVVPDDIDWVKVYDQAATEVGYRMFFEKDRQALNELLTAVFEKTLGVYRKRKMRIPTQIWRAYQGIQVDDSGNTKYGDSGTIGDPVDNKNRWERLQTDAEIIAGDGRLGFRLDSAARRKGAQFEDGYPFHDPDATFGPAFKPWSWNHFVGSDGKVKLPQAYEMIWTVPVEVDEDLFDFVPLQKDTVAGGMRIEEFGPPMELHRNAALQYNEESAANSIVDFPLGSVNRFEVPRVGFAGVKPFQYKRASRELAARVKIAAERHGMSDIEGTVTLETVQVDLIPGTYVRTLEPAGDKPVRIGALIDSVVHDFIQNTTTLHLATIR